MSYDEIAAQAKTKRRNEWFIDKTENRIFRLWPTRSLLYRNADCDWIFAFWWRGNAKFLRLNDRRLV